MNCLSVILGFLFLITGIPNGHTQIKKSIEVEWEMIKDEGNIQVYTRKPKDAKLKEIRIIAEFKLDIDTLLKVLNNANQYTDWVYKCEESKVVSTVNEEEFYYYVTSDLPFPASDRDLVVLCRQWIDKDGIVHSQSIAKPRLMPDVKGFIRIQSYESRWKITPRADGMVHIDYEALSDPGGSIPAWIVNLAIAAGPLKTMKQLEKVVSSAEYVLTR
jgi:hypothetical protein